MHDMQEAEELSIGLQEEPAQTKKQMQIPSIGQPLPPLMMPQPPKLLTKPIRSPNPLPEVGNIGCGTRPQSIAKKHMQFSAQDLSTRPTKHPRTNPLSTEQNAFLEGALALFHTTNAGTPHLSPAAQPQNQQIHEDAIPLPPFSLPTHMNSVIPRFPAPDRHLGLALPKPLQTSMSVSNRPLVKPRLVQSQRFSKRMASSMACCTQQASTTISDEPGASRIPSPTQPQRIQASSRASNPNLIGDPRALQSHTRSSNRSPTSKSADEHSDYIPIPVPRQILAQPKPLRAPTIPSIRPLATTLPLDSRLCRSPSKSCSSPCSLQHRSNATAHSLSSI